MSDESFVREVNEELRQDQMKAVWRRYGMAIVAGVILILAATAGYVGWGYWNEQQANQSGDQFSAALDLANEGRTEEALEALAQLEAEGYGAYPVLARLREATLRAQAEDFEAAIAAFDSVAADSSVPGSIRDMARLRAALLLVDHGSYGDVASRAEPLSDDANALRHGAREAMGLAAWAADDLENAQRLFEMIVDDTAAPANTRQRAEMMVELIAGTMPRS
ncbi:MAG: tetratricopeptide repeat protein [Mesorhizobium sp.]|nr:tetratricopeptide repeat protein [Mesorhizobium sp.]